jgi:NADPH:quinone reductase-like Zn-dependent oxidoreductase
MTPGNRAVRIHRFGGPDVLALETVETPQPQRDTVLVRVHAAGVNPVDHKIRDGKYPPVGKDALPVTLGRDLSGVVAACGEGVTAVRQGDAVFAMLGQDRGGYTDYALVRSAELARKPQRIGDAEAAAVPLPALTAWQGLFDHGGLRAGQRVLIHGGAGGVGHFAVQFAKAKGAHVCTTVGTDDVAFARSLGADEVIDYRTQRFEDTARDIDVVFDLVAGETQERSWAVLKRGGILVSTLTPPSEEQARAHGARGTRYTAQPNGRQLDEIGALIEAGKVRVTVAARFPLQEAGAALDRLEHGHVRGKIVLECVPG